MQVARKQPHANKIDDISKQEGNASNLQTKARQKQENQGDEHDVKHDLEEKECLGATNRHNRVTQRPTGQFETIANELPLQQRDFRREFFDIKKHDDPIRPPNLKRKDGPANREAELRLIVDQPDGSPAGSECPCQARLIIRAHGA